MDTSEKVNMNQILKKIIKIIAVVALVFICLLTGFFIAVSGKVKPEIYQQQILDIIKVQTGVEAKISGIKFSAFPSPKLVISNLTLTGNAPDEPKFSVAKIEIFVAPSSIFSEHPQFSQIAMTRPVLELERAKDGNIHWSWLNNNLLKSLSAKNWNTNLPLVINGGVISYNDSFNEKKFAFEDIGISGVFGENLYLKGSTKIDNHQLNFAIDNKIGDIKLNANDFPINFAIAENAKNYLTIQAVEAANSPSVKLSGKFISSADNVEQWLPSSPQSKKTQEKPVVQTEAKTPASISIAGDFLVDNGVTHLSKLAIDGLNSKGTGAVDIIWKHWYPTISANLDFASLDYEPWKELLKNRIGDTNITEKPKADEVQNYDFRKQNPIPENIEINANITAQKVVDGKQSWGKSKLDGVLESGILTVNELDIELPNGGLASLFGVLSQGGEGELHFQGNMEAKGKSLKQAIAMFNADDIDLPSIGLGEFSMSGNLYISPQKINFSEAKATIEGADISGEIASFLSDMPHAEAKLRFKELNFDSVRDSLRKQKSETQNQKSVIDYGLSFEWLKSLKTKLEAKIFVDSFTALERKGNTASFALSAYDGILKLSDVQLKYPDYTTVASFSLSMQGEQPAVSFTLNTDQIDTSYFNLDTQKQKPMTENDQLNFDWMNNFNGVFDLTIHKLIHQDFTFDKVKMQANLSEKQLNIQSLKFSYAQAQSELSGKIYGGKILGSSIRFTMANADLYELIKSLTGITNIAGLANISGTIATSGKTLKEWLQLMDAKFLLAARSVKVSNVNIAGVSNVVSVSRSSADVVNNVNNVLTKGVTEFAVDGSFSIAGGELRIPTIALRTNAIGAGQITGNLVGGIDLSTMRMQLSTVFGFANLVTSGTPPNMIIQLTGALNKPEIKADTSELEAFVAKRGIKEK